MYEFYYLFFLFACHVEVDEKVFLDYAFYGYQFLLVEYQLVVGLEFAEEEKRFLFKAIAVMVKSEKFGKTDLISGLPLTLISFS